MPNTGKILTIERFSGGKVGTTHVYEFDYTTLTFRPLHVLTDIFCSCAFQIADGRVVSFGGYTNDNLGQALTGVRIYTPSGAPGIDGTTDWFEDPTKSILQVNRWYPGSHALPDGRIVAIGGTTDVAPPGVLQPTIEFLNTPNTPPQFLQYLADTNGANLYPFAWNIPAGGQIPEPGVMAIFARNILGYFDVTTQPGVVTELFRAPNAPVAKPAKAGQRVYPLAGGAFMLPAVPDGNNNPLPIELLICGGSTGSNINATAIDNCIRGFPQQGTNMTWTIEPMPTPRLFPDLVALPDGTVLIINGATKGWSGFSAAQNPIMTALIYNSTAPFGSRYTVVATSTIARLYHSLAILGPDGRVFVLGSTPNANSNINDFGPVWPDEYRIEAYVPAYVSYSGLKPSISAVTYDPDTFSWSYDQSYTITAVVPSGDPANIKFNLLTGKFFNTGVEGSHGHLINSFALLLIISSGGFVTHANHFGQRQAYLLITNAAASTDATASANTFVFTVRAPKNAWVALQGYYMLWIVENNIPAAQANWVQLGGIPPLQADWHPELP
ncbi:glyoxal oxidase N-terminus-domain-containing protein [Geranomyces variabilis]|nr:glyoxal oxidase N-terminus-domain-containing protein [Geranomyces variabilis]